MKNGDLLESALRYAARGLAVFPCLPGHKRPATAHGVLAASTDPSTIQRWWAATPTANIGIACGPSHLVVVDIDAHDERPGIETWRDLLQQLGSPDLQTWCTETPTGGQHIYFSGNGGPEIGNSAGRLGPGLDVRGAGGYVLAPPSIHPNGGIYGWAYGHSPDDLALLPIPSDLAARLTATTPRRATPSGESIPTGQRNATLASLAGTMRRRGLSVEAITAALIEENARRCVPPLTEGEVRAIAESVAGYEPARVAVGPGDYEGAILSLGYTIRFNECGEVLEVNGQPLDDVALATIRHRARQIGFTCGAAVDDTVKALAHNNRYHPVREFLEAARGAYDGGAHIAHLVEHFHDVTRGEQQDGGARDPYFAGAVRRFLIGAVAKAIDGAHNQNPMLVMDAGQGVGKSFFCQWLASPIPGYFLEGPIRPDDKDCWIRLASAFVWEVAELGATTRRADVDALKDFISARVVRVRRPYGRLDMVRPALASFIGTVNEGQAGILADHTGNRRFSIVKIREIDWGYSDEIDPRQLWGEAATAYHKGESWTLDREQLAASEAINELYKTPDVVGSYLAQYFDTAPKDDAWLSTAAIVDHLQGVGLKEHSSRGLAMECARVLTGWGIEKEKRTVGSQRVWGYRGIARR